MNSKIMRIIAWVCTVLGVIGSFVMGKNFENAFSYFNVKGTSLTISGLVSTALMAIVLFSIAKILENTEYTAEKVAAIERMVKSSTPAPEGASNSKMSLSAVTSHTTGSEWRCPKCGKTNPIAVRTCKDCGYQK